jgi:hypothetical protein
LEAVVAATSRSFLESDHVRGLVFGETFRISDHRRSARMR